MLQFKWQAAGALIALAITPVVASADPINILFVGNSFTHGRYQPVLGYNAGAASNPSNGVVHDLLCPGTGTSCTSGVENVGAVNPTSGNTPGATLGDKLNFLQNNPGSQYTEVGPFSGASGIFLQFTKDLGLNYSVSLIAVSSATLNGYLSGTSKADLPLITQSKWNQVVLQDQSFTPLPASITVNGQSVPTRGNPGNFTSAVNGIVTKIDQADATAGVANAKITLYQTPPLAAYGYTSSNPNQPIFGSSTMAQQGGNKAYAPYIGDADPTAAMALDLHNAYFGEAAAFNAANPNGSKVGVANAGDAWVTAMHLGIAEQNPYLLNEPAGLVDLWDSDPLAACCTTPVGYHPSAYGDYLNALVLFGQITGLNPESLLSEFDPNNTNSAAFALGIAPQIAEELAFAAEQTLFAQAAFVPEPDVGLLMVAGLLSLLPLRRRAARKARERSASV
jgi:hypothetical protein